MNHNGVEVIPIYLKEPVRPDDAGKVDVADLIVNNYEVNERDVFVITSKVTSILEGRCIPLDSVVPSKKSLRIAGIYKKHPGLIELIRREGQVLVVTPVGKLFKKKKYVDILKPLSTPGLSDEQWHYLLDFACTYRWGVNKFGFLADNAGIDCQNVPEGYAVLLPENPKKSAENIRAKIKEKTGKNTAVLITDSFGASMLGNLDLPIGYSGIDPIERNWGRVDVFGRLGTGGFGNLVIPLTAMAGAVMGGSDESTPIVAFRGFKYKDERPEDAGKDVMSIPLSCKLEGMLYTLLETIRYFFIWLRP